MISIFQSSSANKSELTEFLKGWLDSNYQVKIEGSSLENGSWASPEGKKLYLTPDAKPSIILHEAMHIWLGLNKNFKARYLDNNFDESKLEIIERSSAKEFRDLTSLISIVFEKEQTLSEPSKIMLKKILGENEHYDDVYLLHRKPNGILEELLGLKGDSFIGNICDESQALNQPKSGHPMKSYHEFFASSVATLAFGSNDYMPSKLKQLKSEILKMDISSQDYNGLVRIYGNLNHVLKVVCNMGNEIVKEMEKHGILPTDIENLKSNLAALEKALKESELEVKKPKQQKTLVR